MLVLNNKCIKALPLKGIKGYKYGSPVKVLVEANMIKPIIKPPPKPLSPQKEVNINRSILKNLIANPNSTDSWVNLAQETIAK